MTVRNVDFEESPLIVLHSENGKEYDAVWTVYDTSETVYSRWVAFCWTEKNPQIDNQRYEMLTKFSDLESLMLWCAHRQHVYHDEIRAGLRSDFEGEGFLEKNAVELGYDGWEHFKAEWMEHIGVKSIVCPKCGGNEVLFEGSERQQPCPDCQIDLPDQWQERNSSQLTQRAPDGAKAAANNEPSEWVCPRCKHINPIEDEHGYLNECPNCHVLILGDGV